ncbi:MULTISPECIES: hypothetical protein [unclassified Streptomyces]|nr:hypothetical protein [Streptomyces sp. CB09001]
MPAKVDAVGERVAAVPEAERPTYFVFDLGHAWVTGPNPGRGR